MTRSARPKPPLATHTPPTRTIEGYGTPRVDLPSAPYCFNGAAHVFRYRVTIERVEEPAEVLRARIQELCETSDNSHDMPALRAVAAEAGVEIAPAQWGKRRARKEKSK